MIEREIVSGKFACRYRDECVFFFNCCFHVILAVADCWASYSSMYFSILFLLLSFFRFSRLHFQLLVFWRGRERTQLHGFIIACFPCLFLLCSCLVYNIPLSPLGASSVNLSSRPAGNQFLFYLHIFGGTSPARRHVHKLLIQGNAVVVIIRRAGLGYTQVMLLEGGYGMEGGMRR